MCETSAWAQGPSGLMLRVLSGNCGHSDGGDGGLAALGSLGLGLRLYVQPAKRQTYFQQRPKAAMKSVPMSEKTSRLSRVSGYVIIGSGIAKDCKEPYREIRAWVEWASRYADVALVSLLTDKDEADCIIIPARMRWGTRWLWRLLARWYNTFRIAANQREKARRDKYFSPEEVEKRVRLRVL